MGVGGGCGEQLAEPEGSGIAFGSRICFLVEKERETKTIGKNLCKSYVKIVFHVKGYVR